MGGNRRHLAKKRRRQEHESREAFARSLVPGHTAGVIEPDGKAAETTALHVTREGDEGQP